jgi:hypothetical protein
MNLNRHFKPLQIAIYGFDYLYIIKGISFYDNEL